MSAPRIEVDLSKIRHNTQTAVHRLQRRGINVTAVTKAVCGHPAIAQAMLQGGASGLADARLSNVQRLRAAGITCPVTLIRTPMLSQVDDVVQTCEASYNTELAVVAALAAEALRRDTVHGIILMVEMGDRREGIAPESLSTIVQQVLTMPGVVLKGIGANFACLNGTAPTVADMTALSGLATETEIQCGFALETVSGGNSANLPWALGVHPTGRTNDLRLGEAILLGVDPVTGTRISGMHTDAFTLVAEVIETTAQPAPLVVSFANRDVAKLRLVPNNAHAGHMLLAIGHQDTDVAGLSVPPGHTLVGATSDHLVLVTELSTPSVGAELRFQMDYNALMRAMAAPDIKTRLLRDRPASHLQTEQRSVWSLAPV